MIRKNVERFNLGYVTDDGVQHVYYPTTYSKDAVERMVDGLNNELKWRELKTETGEKIIEYLSVRADFGPADCF